jgi:hypothetical protein
MFLSPTAGADMPIPDETDLHRSYSLDHIQALITQAASIADQEDLALLARFLTTVSQLVAKCRT